MKRYFTWPRAIFAAILLLVFVAWWVPTLTAGWCRDRLLRALEEGLGRKIEIGEVQFRLVPTPGFAISDVTIGEEPAVGLEPAAYIKTLVAQPSLPALLTGRFVVGSVRLEDASLNLARVDSGVGGVRWNFSSLTSGKPGTAREFPAIHMIGGRINLKFGDTKSIFYLSKTDVDLSPASATSGAMTIRVGGQPARTDRPSRGFGSFVASGQWNSADHSLELDVKMAKSELSDLLTLFEGRESVLLGKVDGDAHLSGPVSKIGITGHLNVAGLHGWNQLPPGGSAWPFTIGGTADATGQVIELQASGAGKPSPIGVHYRVSDYLGRPQWAVAVSLDGVPVAPLTGMARNFGIALPVDLTMDGLARGSIGYSATTNAQGMEGLVRVANLTLAAQDSPPLKIAQADVKFDGSSITLSPASIVNDAGESAAIEGSYDTVSGEMQVSLTSSGMAIASLRRQISVAGAPIIGLATAGIWSGSLRYANSPADDTEAGWTGDIHLKDTDIPFEAFAEPVRVLEADATIDETGVVVKKMRLTLGGITAQGDYSYETGAVHPHRFRIVLPSASAADIEKVLRPALRRASFLTYAFNFGRVPEPDWLRNMHAEGTIQAGSLDLAGTTIANLRARVIWDDASVSFAALTGRLSGATFTGNAAIHLASRQPRYEVNGSLSGFAWRGGTVEASGSMTTSGMGTDLLANLRVEGSFRGKRLEVAPPDPWDIVEGRFDLAWAKTNPKLRLSALTIQTGGSKWTGSAETQDSGQMVLKVADGARHMEASGALLRGEGLKLAQ